MNGVRLSQNFWLHEYTRSERAARMGRILEPDIDIVNELRLLSTEVMEPVRTHLGAKVVSVLSGWRPLWLNDMTPGSSRKSDHLRGGACDFNVATYTPLQACRAIATIIHQLPINQLILEFGAWIHISRAQNGEEPARQVLHAHYVNGRLVYSAGLPSLN